MSWLQGDVQLKSGLTSQFAPFGSRMEREINPLTLAQRLKQQDQSTKLAQMVAVRPCNASRPRDPNLTDGPQQHAPLPGEDVIHLHGTVLGENQNLRNDGWTHETWNLDWRTMDIDLKQPRGM